MAAKHRQHLLRFATGPMQTNSPRSYSLFMGLVPVMISDGNARPSPRCSPTVEELAGCRAFASALERDPNGRAVVLSCGNLESQKSPTVSARCCEDWPPAPLRDGTGAVATQRLANHDSETGIAPAIPLIFRRSPIAIRGWRRGSATGLTAMICTLKRRRHGRWLHRKRWTG